MSNSHNTPELNPTDTTSERPLPQFNAMQQVKRRFFAMRNGLLGAQMRSRGLDYGIIFGLNIPQIKEIAEEILQGGLTSGELLKLSNELWANERTRESRLLAPMIYPADLMTSPLAKRWLSEAQTTEIADHLCHSLLRKLPCAAEIAEDVISNTSSTDMQLYSSLRLLMNLLVIGKADAARVSAAIQPVAKSESALLKGVLRQITDELEFLSF